MSLEWKENGKTLRGPSWGELVAQATSLLGFQDPDLARVRGTDLQILEYFKQKHAGQTAKLTNWLSRLDPPDSAIVRSTIHDELAKLDRCKLFYTTNFDNFIERAFDLHKRAHKVVAVEAQMGLAQSGCEIVKFHGDLDHPDQIVLTESDYEARLSLSTALDHRLRADLLGRVVLFIGYSFRDPNVSYLFRLFTDEFWEKRGSLPGDRAYIIVPDPSDFEYELFEARRIRVIPVRTSNITLDVAAILEEMRG
ncbi:MAG TPA: SIR2 family protein [Pirellulales bacterium]|nr:SIR2 family protein [Pirellulales bacterium]